MLKQVFCLSKNVITRGVRDGRDEGIVISENFENPVIVSQTTLQCCIAACKICKYVSIFFCQFS